MKDGCCIEKPVVAEIKLVPENHKKGVLIFRQQSIKMAQNLSFYP